MKRNTSQEKKKVEFSPSLASIDSNSPSVEWSDSLTGPARINSSTTTWDTETGKDVLVLSNIPVEIAITM